MSYVSFDYQCPSCGVREPRFIRRAEMDEQYCHRCGPGNVMVRLPAAPATTFKFADPSATKRRRT